MAVEITNSLLSLQPGVEAEAALPPQSFHWQLEDYAYFHKCGEITTSPDVQCFGFNCAFCPAICLQFSVFIDHIRSQHMQDMRRRYEVADEKIEQTTQTDFNLMLMDMHMDSDIFQMDATTEQAAGATTTAVAVAATTTATTMSTTNAIRPDKRTKKTNWNETWGSAAAETTLGLANVCMDLGMGMDMGNVGPQTQSQLQASSSSNNNNATLLQLSNKSLITTTTTTTTTTPAEIDFVHVLENPLPPSPHPYTQPVDSPRLHSIDSCGMIHDLSDVAAAAAAAVPITSLPPPAYAATLEANSRGALSVATPHRYETRRVVSIVVNRNR